MYLRRSSVGAEFGLCDCRGVQYCFDDQGITRPTTARTLTVVCFHVYPLARIVSTPTPPTPGAFLREATWCWRFY